MMPARTPRALLNSFASTVVLNRTRFMPQVCHAYATTSGSSRRLGGRQTAKPLGCEVNGSMANPAMVKAGRPEGSAAQDGFTV